MLDQFGRNIEYIRISVTDRCNLRCQYCMPEKGVDLVPHAEILRFGEILHIASVLTELGISKIRLTGGEPLVRKNLASLVRDLKALPGIKHVSLTTNGVLLGAQIGDLAAAGIDAVNVSLDSLDPAYFHEVTRVGDIQDVLRSLEKCREFPNVRIKINCVPVAEDEGGSKEHWFSVASLAKDSPFDVRFIEMMPIGFGARSQGISEEMLRKKMDAVYGTPSVVSERLGNGPATYVQYPGFESRIGFISAVTHKFCDTCNRVRLTSTGMLKPCLQFAGGADLKALLRSGADDEALKEAMREVIYRKPEGHLFLKDPKEAPADREMETKKMSQIGG